MDNNDELTIAARVKGWEIFSPDWDYLRQYPALELGSLCALSVGLHPYFADPSWVFSVAKPHFNGTNTDEFCPIYDAEEGANRAALLDDFLRRAPGAAANLSPLGALTPAIGDADSVQTLVRVTDFVTWAEDMGWELPPEFPRAEKAPQAPTAQEPESPPRVSGEPAPRPDLFALPGVKTTDIIEAFNLVGKKWRDLRKTSCYRKKAIHTPGGKGKPMHTWKPADFAICLLETGERKLPSALRAIITNKWPEWLPDFESQLEDYMNKSGKNSPV